MLIYFRMMERSKKSVSEDNNMIDVSFKQQDKDKNSEYIDNRSKKSVSEDNNMIDVSFKQQDKRQKQ